MTIATYRLDTAGFPTDSSGRVGEVGSKAATGTGTRRGAKDGRGMTTGIYTAQATAPVGLKEGIGTRAENRRAATCETIGRGDSGPQGQARTGDMMAMKDLTEGSGRAVERPES
jgi:hypothetical protein